MVGGGPAGGMGAVGTPGIGVGMPGGRALPGIGSMTGLGGSMQSFLGEAGMYPDSSGSGMDSNSIKDEFSGADSSDCRNNNSSSLYSNGNGNNNGSSGSNGSHHHQYPQQQHLNTSSGSGVADNSNASKLYGSHGRDLGGGCKIEEMDQEQEEELEHEQEAEREDDQDHEHEEDDPDDDELGHDEDSDEDNDEDEDALGGGSAMGDDDEGDHHHPQHQQHDAQQQDGGGGSLRGLGRIFGIGTHPVVAEAQARAEALVHGRGGARGGGSTSAAEAAEKKRKRAVLSKEERAKQNRDRNREHARNTRLRKKAFVEELKKQVGGFLLESQRVKLRITWMRMSSLLCFMHLVCSPTCQKGVSHLNGTGNPMSLYSYVLYVSPHQTCLPYPIPGTGTS